MIRQHRTIHRRIWLLLAPLLLVLIIAFSNPRTELYPANDHLPELPGEVSGKGILP